MLNMLLNSKNFKMLQTSFQNSWDFSVNIGNEIIKNDIENECPADIYKTGAAQINDF